MEPLHEMSKDEMTTGQEDLLAGVIIWTTHILAAAAGYWLKYQNGKKKK